VIVVGEADVIDAFGLGIYGNPLSPVGSFLVCEKKDLSLLGFLCSYFLKR